MDLIEGIFPQQSIHLVAGPTGAGKTRWLLEILLAWDKELPVLGRPTYRCPWLYVSGDRAEIDAVGTMISLGIDPAEIPLLPAFGVMPPMSALDVLREVDKLEAQLIVWEGFGQYVESNAGSSAVKRWLNLMTWALTHHEDKAERENPLTIIGVMEQPKMKPRDQYLNPRQRISGPAAWGHSASTVVLIEHEDKNCKGPLRTVGIYPHHAGPEMEFRASLASGHFVMIR